MLSVPAFFFFLYIRIYRPTLPDPKHPLIFYSNQTGDDLKKIIVQAINKSKQSLFVQIYGCTDSSVITSLQRSKAKGSEVSIFYDPSGSGPLREKIPGAAPLIRKGLMHKKILVVDNDTVFIGTANFTPTSLSMHDNLILGLYAPGFANDILHSLSQHVESTVQGQKVEFWHLPDVKNRCMNAILGHLANARESIDLALFTFTHPKILNALAEAKLRGVSIRVFLDSSAAQGASKQAVSFLEERKIPVYIGKPGKLLHYKWCLIDEKTVLFGSANWTKSAFAINEDCVSVVHDLTERQREQFRTIRKKIKLSSVEKKI